MPVKIVKRGWLRGVLLFQATVLAAIGLGGLSSSASSLPAGLILGIGVLLVVRCWRIRLEVTPTTITVYNAFRTHSFAKSELSHASFDSVFVLGDAPCLTLHPKTGRRVHVTAVAGFGPRDEREADAILNHDFRTIDGRSG